MIKKIFLISITFSTLLFGQHTERKSLLELKSQIKTNFLENESLEYNIPQATITGKKSPGLAVLYSLLLPGMGELYAGNYNSGKYFTIAEGAFWLTYIGMNVYGEREKDNYKAYASEFAGANVSEGDEDYMARIGEYVSVQDYNREKRLERDFAAVYDETKFFWDWETDNARNRYRDMWVSSEQAFNNLRFAVGAMIVNRIISAINAARITSAYNKSLESEVGWNVSMGTQNIYQEDAGLSLNFVTSF